MLGLEMTSFGVDDGYVEAICRSLRKGFLRDDQYLQLKSCSNLQEFKLVLEDTDYAPYIVNEANPIEIVVLKKRCKEKLMIEIQHMLGQSTQPLTGFLERMLHGYQIENVVGMIEGLKNEQPLDLLLKGLDPLGYFPELKNIKTVEGDDYATLYQQVLIDLPIGEYFRKFLDQCLSNIDNMGGMKKDARFISDMMKEFKAEKIKNMLKKIWLADFHRYCMDNLPGDVSRAVMDDLLKFESDCMTIQIIYNSTDIQGLSNAVGREVERRKYINQLGYLYPDKDQELNQADSFDKLKQAVKGYEYERMLEQVSDQGGKDGAGFSSQGKSIDDVMFIEKAKRYSMAFENGFHYGVFYGYLKLREMEIKNLVWLAELVSIGVPRQMPGWNKYVLPFKYHKEGEVQGQQQ
jgi:V-type H+-transporting ATPase subunit d